MRVQVDKLGRIVIPKKVRERLGLKAGSILRMEESSHVITLKVMNYVSQIKIKGGIAVFIGHAVGDIESAIQRKRNKRLKA